MFSAFIVRAVSSGGERYLDTVEVTGSKPVSPTIGRPGHKAVYLMTFFDSASKMTFLPNFCPNDASEQTKIIHGNRSKT